MKIKFNAPKNEPPKEAPKKDIRPIGAKPEPAVQKTDDDRKFDWGGKAVAGRPRKPEDVQAHAELQVEMKALETIITSFFAKYGDLKSKFESDPEMFRKFKADLANVMHARVKIDKVAPSDLQDDAQLKQKLFELSFEYEGEIKKRQDAAGRQKPPK